MESLYLSKHYREVLELSFDVSFRKHQVAEVLLYKGMSYYYCGMISQAEIFLSQYLRVFKNFSTCELIALLKVLIYQGKIKQATALLKTVDCNHARGFFIHFLQNL